MGKNRLYAAAVLLALLGIFLAQRFSEPVLTAPQLLLSEEQLRELSRFPKPITQATKADLMAVEGIGEATAEAILRYLDSHQLRSMEQLTQIDGIGEQKLAALKEYFTLNGMEES